MDVDLVRASGAHHSSPGFSGGGAAADRCQLLYTGYPLAGKRDTHRSCQNRPHRPLDQRSFPGIDGCRFYRKYFKCKRLGRFGSGVP